MDQRQGHVHPGLMTVLRKHSGLCAWKNEIGCEVTVPRSVMLSQP